MVIVVVVVRGNATGYEYRRNDRAVNGRLSAGRRRVVKSTSRETDESTRSNESSGLFIRIFITMLYGVRRTIDSWLLKEGM